MTETTGSQETVAITDEFGRVVRTEDQQENQQQTRTDRHLIDAITNIDHLKPIFVGREKAAIGITGLIISVHDKYTRKLSQDVDNIALKLFEGYAANVDLIAILFVDALQKMSPQIEILVALIGCFCTKYAQTLLPKIINEMIPGALKVAFTNDQFTTVKLLIRALYAFAAYGFITPDSLVAQITKIAEKIPGASLFRQESLCRAIIVSCKLQNPKIPEESLKPIIEIITKSSRERSDAFIKLITPIKGTKMSVVNLLQEINNPINVYDQYLGLFENITAINLTPFDVEFGEIDRAPYPIMLAIYEQIADDDYKPLLADLCLDILMFYGEDPLICIEQLLSVNTIMKNSRSLNNNDVPALVTTYVMHVIVAVLLTDLLQLPYGIHPPIFHTSIVSQLFMISHLPAPYVFSEAVTGLVQRIGDMDVGCYHRFVSFLAHLLSQFEFAWPWDRWEMFLALPKEDLCFVFLCNLCLEMKTFSVTSILLENIPPPFHHLILGDQLQESPFKLEQSLENLASGLREVIENEPSKLEEAVKSYALKVDEWGSLKLLAHCLFYPSKGSCEVVFLEFEKFEDYLHTAFQEEWSQELLVDSASIFFADRPTVLRQIYLYFVNKNYVDPKTFIKWFFDLIRKENLAKPNFWKVFRDVFEGVFIIKLAAGKKDEVIDLFVNVYTCANDLYTIEKLSLVANHFFIGNLRDFGRRNIEIFKLAEEQLNNEDIINKQSMKLEFKNMFADISQLADPK